MAAGKLKRSGDYPGTRAWSAPTINYVKISDSPGLVSCASYHPSEVIIFQDELLLTARENTHELVADAIGRMEWGMLLVNSPKAPGEINCPLTWRLCGHGGRHLYSPQRLLKRNSSPVGLALLGA